MVDIAPFQGLVFDPGAVDDLARVVAPPYDVIAEADRDALESLSPYNVVRLVLGRDEPSDDDRDNKYVRARALLDAWEAARVIREDDTDAFYIYEQHFTVDGAPRVQRGILAAVALDDPSAGGVLPHERTYDDIVDDRLALLRATATNLDTIFCVYGGADPAAADVLDGVASGEPILRFADADGEQRLWRLDDPDGVATLVKALADVRVVIADGHHRHRTAQRYRDERRAAAGEGPWDRQLMFLVDAGRNGPALLPIHRLIDAMDARTIRERLSGAFDVEPADASDPEALAAALTERRAGGRRVFALLAGDGAWWLTVADEAAERAAMPADRSAGWRDLDVAVLHTWVFEQLLGSVTPRFVHHAHEAVAELADGTASAAFLLAPAPFDAVLAVAEEGEAMPQKSTYFIPKPKTGIVMRSLR